MPSNLLEAHMQCHTLRDARCQHALMGRMHGDHEADMTIQHRFTNEQVQTKNRCNIIIF